MLILYTRSNYRKILNFFGGVRLCSGGVTRKMNEVGGLSSTPLIKIVRSVVTIVVGGFNPPNPPGNSHYACGYAA